MDKAMDIANIEKLTAAVATLEERIATADTSTKSGRRAVAIWSENLRGSKWAISKIQERIDRDEY